MHSSLRHEFLYERQLYLFEQSGLYQRVVAYSLQLSQSLGTLSGFYVTGEKSSFYGSMSIIVHLIFSYSFERGDGVIILAEVHHSAHIVHTDAAQLIVDINIVGPFGMDILKHGNGSVGIAQTAKHGVFAVKQILRIAMPTTRLTNIYQSIVKISARHGCIEKISQRFFRMLSFIKFGVGGISIVS